MGLVGHLRTQCNHTSTTSTSATSASNPPTMTTTIPTIVDHSIDIPPPKITDTFLPPSPIPCADHANELHLPHSRHLSGHLRLPPACYHRHHSRPSTSDGDSVLTCPHCNRTFTSRISLVGHLRIHRTSFWSTNT
ncbi:unnamed protein product [Schistocephalus solidus]|uniref:C2H2-type domain-containing protein n=1 Tax=Schistocephalus solidus TaxID=70667 RepID=A0A183T7Y0_SCHSO|nr:unnamed protein product [Schistocephalus solidus]